MPNISISLRPGEAPNQATLGSAAPTTAGTVELRIGDGIGHAKVWRALQSLLSRIRADNLRGT
jgi:hypothetical protein